MNKKQVVDICKEHILFQIITNKYTSPKLNMDKIDFIGDNIIKITHSSTLDVYLQTKDIIMIEGVR